MTIRQTNQQHQQTFRRLLWSIPLSIFIHNLEEYPRIVDYAQRHGITINRRQMGIAVALATILPVPITAAAISLPTKPGWLQLALALPALMAVNAGAHLAQTIITRDYSPGTITGITINIPLAFYLYKQAIGAGIMTPRETRQAIIVGACLMAPAALILQFLGWSIDRGLRTHPTTSVYR